jgi:ribosomal protein S6--L-glutamate ligase
MRLAILSRKRTLYSTRRMIEAARARGHEPVVMDPLNFDIRIGTGRPELFYNRRPLKPVGAVVPRIGQSITFYGLAVVRQFEMMGVYTVNGSQAIARSRDKLRSLQLLSRHDIGMPDTVFSRHPEHVRDAIDMVGGAPVIIKLTSGTQGVGVVLADSETAAESMIETLYSLNQNILVQRYIAESKGRDVRAFVVGRKVVAAMTRTADGEEEFRSNIHRGGKGEAVRLPVEYRRTAVKAAEVMGLNVAGVDMLISDKGPLVMEVNSSPGLEGIEGATGVDVAAEIIAFVERDARRHERRRRLAERALRAQARAEAAAANGHGTGHHHGHGHGHNGVTSANGVNGLAAHHPHPSPDTADLSADDIEVPAE